MLKRLRARLPRRSVVYARARALISRHPLPPGDLVRLDVVEKQDRTFLLRRATEVGPIFKALAWGDLWVCVVGLERGRRLLREHGAALRPVTLQLEPLFPKGFLRQMQGEDHRRYRKALLRAIRGEDLAANRRGLDTIAADALARYAATPRADEDAAADFIRTLNAAASGMLVQIFFGSQFGTPAFDRVMAGYQRLGPYGLVWQPGPAQHAAFAEIRDFLLAEFAGAAPPPGAEASILGHLVREGALDATLLGNLIYMVEMGRYDTYSLFRWLAKYAADFPALLEAIAREDASAAPPAGRRSLAEAFVIEALRTDQSERLTRVALRDIVFDGLLIPRHATVRVCLWEPHHAAAVFPDPFRFDPARWTGEKDPGADEFAPFGLDAHQCPFGDLAIGLAVIFLRALARAWVPVATGEGLPVKGLYHWEPASRFGVKLRPRGPMA
ncbi:MAG: cytochrome P450 [Opitutaceae bacterium]|nr:cytochrome P450 [Opitutaceae bacterium]